MKLLFDVGDVVTIDSAGGFNGKAQIVAIRHAIGNYRTGTMSVGADVLRGDGNVSFYYLHDLARWNAEKLDKLNKWGL